MERKTVILVYWKATRRYETYSSLAAFCAHNPAWPRHLIYQRQRNAIYSDAAIELRRVMFNLNTKKTRRGGIRRWKPGPQRTGTVKRY